MKKIKIKIFWFDRNPDELKDHFIYKSLSKFYDVEFSDSPDYVFYNDATFDYLKYKNAVKIFYTGENVSPNFNLCDYAIGFDYMNFEDRYYRLPLYLITVFYNQRDLELAGDTDFKDRNQFTKEDLSKKTGFCSFVYSNYRASPKRKIFFDLLNIYKKVNSGGAYLNNVGGRVASKMEFESKHKFSIAFENSSGNGYTTEKLVNSLAARTIPIYWGNPLIGKEFNTKRFINCHEYKDFEEVVKRVREIDENDELYLEIMNEPVTVPSYIFEDARNGFDDFLKNIIDQPIEKAKRRDLNNLKYAEIENNEIVIGQISNTKNILKKTIARIYQPLKKMKFMEDLKIRFFKQ